MSAAVSPRGSHGSRRSPLIRLYEWLLDEDGDIYGDERSRQYWYEAIAAAASLQWIVIPWALAILVWVVPTGAVWALAVIFGLQMLLTLTMFPFLKQRRIDYTRQPKSRKAKVIQVVSVAPVLVFALGLTLGTDLRRGTSRSVINGALQGALVGSVIGGVVAVVLMRRSRQKFRAAEAAGDDE
jgi:uncharacterized protein (DUF58 family)